MKKNELNGLPIRGNLRKALRIMKLTTVLLLVFVFQTFAVVGYAQRTQLTLDMKNTSVEDALYEIEQQSDYVFLYNRDLIDVSRKSNLKVKNAKIETVLQQLFEGSGVGYQVIDRQVVLSIKDVQQQKRTVSGKVTDLSGQPLPGVTVLIKGTTQGTITDYDGKYTIAGVPAEGVLVFSFVGMKTQEILVGDQTAINVVLEEDAIGIEEVVAIGYGTMKKSDLTGNVSRVNTEKTVDLPNVSVIQSLKGNVAGLSVGTPDKAGEEPSLKVRGTNSLSAKNEPLIVIDGIIYNGSLNSLDASDVESVDVLKDASAAAVYGSRSANGVLIITTKKGESDKPVFNFNASYGVSNPVSLIPVLSPDQYLQKILDYRVASGQEANPDNIHDYLTITESNNLKNGKTIDWYDELVKPAENKTYTGSVSGRSKRTNYYISASYLNQEGIVENDDFERFTARANFTNKITDWFSLSVKSSFANLDYSGVAVDWAFMLSPYSNYYKDGAENGEYEYYPMEDPYYRHPYLSTQIEDHDVRTDLWGLISSEINVPFVKGLKWTMNYSLNQRINRKFQFQDKTLAITQNGSASKKITEFYDWTLDNILNYKRKFNDHSIDATFLYSREYQRASETGASATDFFSQVLGYNSLELGGVPLVASAYGEQNQLAYMGRLNYIFKDTYALTGTIRRDGFSGFAEGNKYATFLSGAFAWTVTNEAFMSDISWLDRLKLRLSWGENGNQAIGRYQTLARMSTDQLAWGERHAKYVFGDGVGTSNGAYVSSMANSNLGWETTQVLNLGVDFGVFNNLINGSVDVYSSATKDILLERSIPNMTGHKKVWTNIGEVSNKGIEIALNSTPINNRNFTWDIGFNFDLNRNEIVSLFGVDDDNDGIEDDDIANKWFIGKPLGVFYGYGIDGIHQLGDTDIPNGYQPGDFRIVDYEEDGELTPEDRYILGYNAPNYTFSISNTLVYKNWSLYMMINSIQGGGKNNYYMGNNIVGHNPNDAFPSWTQRFSFPAMDYWTPDNPSNTAARIDYVAPRGHAYLEDRSFIRLQDVILSYNFSKEMLGKLNMKGLRMYLSGKNLLTITDWTGYDPENATTINGRPLMYTVSIGADIKF